MKRFATILALVVATDASAQWTQVASIPSSDIFNVWANGDTITAAAESTAFVSVNGGATWIPSTPIVPGAFDGVSNMEGVRMRNGRLYAGTRGHGVFVSNDLGATWQDFNQGLVGGFGNSQLIIMDLLLRGDSLYAGTGGSGVWIRNLKAGTWSHYGNALEPSQAAFVEGVSASPTRLMSASGVNGDVYFRETGDPDWTISYLINNTVMAGLSAQSAAWTGHAWLISTNIGVFRSPTGTSPWVYTDFGLHPTFFSSFTQRGNVLFTSFANGQGTGIESSTDDGVSWHVFDSQPGIFTYALAISGSNMYAGRVDGLWRQSIETVAVPDPPVATRLAFAIAGANPVGADVRFRFDLAAPARIRLEVFDVKGRRMAGSVGEDRPAGANEIRWSARGLAPGMYFARLSAGDLVETARLVRAR